MDKFWHVTLRDGPERHWAQYEVLDIFADKKDADEELACGVHAYCFVKVGRALRGITLGLQLQTLLHSILRLGSEHDASA